MIIILSFSFKFFISIIYFDKGATLVVKKRKKCLPTYIEMNNEMKLIRLFSTLSAQQMLLQESPSLSKYFIMFNFYSGYNNDRLSFWTEQFNKSTKQID